MKYKTYAKRVVKKHAFELVHDILEDMNAVPLPVAIYPRHLILPLFMDFLVRNPRAEETEWYGYVLYMCIPGVEKLVELYRAENGDEQATIWIEDLYYRILEFNPFLDYKMLSAYQEPTQDRRIIYVNFKKFRRA